LHATSLDKGLIIRVKSVPPRPTSLTRYPGYIRYLRTTDDNDAINAVERSASKTKPCQFSSVQLFCVCLKSLFKTLQLFRSSITAYTCVHFLLQY